VPLGEGWQYSVVPGSTELAAARALGRGDGSSSIYNGMIAPLRRLRPSTGRRLVPGRGRLSACRLLCRPARGDDGDLCVGQLGRSRSAVPDRQPRQLRTLSRPRRWKAAGPALREQQRLAAARDPPAALSSPWTWASGSTSIPPTSRKSAAASPAPRGAWLTAPPSRSAGDRPRAPHDDGIILDFNGSHRQPAQLERHASARFRALRRDPGELPLRRTPSPTATHVRLADDGRPATRVRYGWADSPVTNLYDEVPLPVGPFEVPMQ
jgi:sialate O-acetylesterase